MAERIHNQALVGCSIVGIAGAVVFFGAIPFYFWQRSIDAPARIPAVQAYGEARPIPSADLEREARSMRTRYEEMKAAGDRSFEFHSLKALFEPDDATPHNLPETKPNP